MFLVQEGEEKENRRNQKEEQEEEEELKEEEITKAIDKLKRKKAAGIEEILAEVWRFGEQTVRKEIMDLLL